MKKVSETALRNLRGYERKVLNLLPIAPPVTRAVVMTKLQRAGIKLSWEKIDGTLNRLRKLEYIKQVSGGTDAHGFRPEFAKTVLIVPGKKEPTEGEKAEAELKAALSALPSLEDRVRGAIDAIGTMRDKLDDLELDVIDRL